jgi:hypothetical protein
MLQRAPARPLPVARYFLRWPNVFGLHRFPLASPKEPKTVPSFREKTYGLWRKKRTNSIGVEKLDLCSVRDSVREVLHTVCSGSSHVVRAQNQNDTCVCWRDPEVPAPSRTRQPTSCPHGSFSYNGMCGKVGSSVASIDAKHNGV